MKALLVVEDDAISELIKYYIKPLGLDIIHYRDPIKALDNLEEVQPDAVIMSATDFPRHWKSIVVDIRSLKPKTKCAIILLKGQFFSFDEAAKAAFLGVNGVIKEDLSDISEVARFQSILKRYIDVDDSRKRRIIISPGDSVGLLFSLPGKAAIVSGKVNNLSMGGISFLADQKTLVSELEPGLVIEDASLRLEENIFSVNLNLLRNGVIMAFSFDHSKELHNSLDSYLSYKTSRDIKKLLNQ